MEHPVVFHANENCKLFGRGRMEVVLPSLQLSFEEFFVLLLFSFSYNIPDIYISNFTPLRFCYCSNWLFIVLWWFLKFYLFEDINYLLKMLKLKMQGVIKLDKLKMFLIMEWGTKKAIVVPVIIEALWYGTKRKWKKIW